jgi:S1-C subfamily serine protease
LSGLSDELVALVARVAPCVVALSGTGSGFTSSGSGFLIDDQGHAVTNQHVIDGLGSPLDVTLHGGIRARAAVVGSDEIADIAVVKIDAAIGHFLRLRDGAPRLGELCVAMGSPFGDYPESVSLGVVSGLARTIHRGAQRPIDQAIQTDAAVNPGNSGGPLVDVAGLVLGVNQSIDTRGQSLGFAVPADIVRWVSAELISTGTVVRATLGATVVKRTVEIAGAARVGLAVLRASKDAPSDGLAVDDVIVEVGGTAVDEPGDLYRILRKEVIGTPITLQVLRAGAMVPVTVTPTKLGG